MKVEIAKSRLQGKGVFAIKPIKKDEKIFDNFKSKMPKFIEANHDK